MGVRVRARFTVTTIYGLRRTFAAGVENPHHWIVIIAILIGRIAIAITILGLPCENMLGTEAHCHHQDT